MPNQIDSRLSQALGSAFGGSPTSAVPQQPTPTPPPSGGSGVGSLFQALFGPSQPAAAAPVDPYKNLANKATGQQYK